MIYNNAVGVPSPDGWELTTDSSDVATWKAYEEVRFNPDLIHRWVREGNEYVNRMTKEQMEALKQQLELAEWIEETDEQVIANAEKRFPFLKRRELTDAEILEVCSQIEPFDDITIEQAFIEFARAILKKASEK